MNRSEDAYSKYALVQEMMDVVDVVNNFDPGQTSGVSKDIASVGRLFLTGEGSSRIFPANKSPLHLSYGSVVAHPFLDCQAIQANHKLHRRLICHLP